MVIKKFMKLNVALQMVMSAMQRRYRDLGCKTMLTLPPPGSHRGFPQKKYLRFQNGVDIRWAKWAGREESTPQGPVATGTTKHLRNWKRASVAAAKKNKEERYRLALNFSSEQQESLKGYELR